MHSHTTDYTAHAHRARVSLSSARLSLHMASRIPPDHVEDEDNESVEEGFGQSVVLTARIRSILRGCTLHDDWCHSCDECYDAVL